MRIGILNYGLGNLLSIARAFEAVGARETAIVHDEVGINNSDLLVLPGVGAFPKAMENLRNSGISELLEARFTSGKPSLGICLGMQLMFESSEEFGTTKGFGIFEGTVTQIGSENNRTEKTRRVRIGWYPLQFIEGEVSRELSFGTQLRDRVYFAHSYAVKTDNYPNHIAVTPDGDCRLAAIVAVEANYGMQFHPEKSGKIGLQIIDNLVNRLL